MLVYPSLNPVWPVYLPDPVAKDHPLNRECKAWWLTLTNWEGGPWWYDLFWRYTGTLANMGVAGNGWRSTTRPGGWGHLVGTGALTDLYVTLMPAAAAPINLAATASLSLACWFRCGSMTGFPYLVGFGQNATAGGCGIGVQPVSGGSNSVYATLSDSGGYYFPSPASNVGTDNLWHRALLVVDRGAGVLSLYLDGKPSTSGSIGTSATVTPSYPLYALRRADTACAAASVDGVKLWARALTAADAQADYDLERLGCPGLLNRMVLLPPAAAAAIAAQASHHYRRRRAG